MDEAVEMDLDDLNYKDDNDWGNYALGMAKILSDHGYRIGGLEAAIYGNIPNGAGLSSSASLELLIGEMFNQIYNDGKIPRLELVRFGQLCENEFIGVRSGIMDQFAIGMGKKDHAIHLNTDTLEYRYVRGVLPGHVFVIMNTAKRRELKDSKYNVRREECERALAQLQEKQAIRTLSEIKPQKLDTLMPSVSDPVLQKRVRHVVTENVRVQEMMQAMETGDTEKMGRILNEGHASLRDDYEVTGPELDAITKRAREHPNCVGARMTGAGFGGCAIALVEKEAVDSFTSFVGEPYFKDTGLVAGFFVSELAGGTEEREERA